MHERLHWTAILALLAGCSGNVGDVGRDAGGDAGASPDGASAEVGAGDASSMDASTEASVRDGAGADAPASTAEDACNAIYAAWTARYSACDGRPPQLGTAVAFVAELGHPSISGSMRSDLQYECSRVADDVAKGVIRFDPTKLAACESDIQSTTCNTLFGVVVSLPVSCSAALMGSVPDQGSCTLSEECATAGGNCYDTGSCPGKCGSTLTIGEACGGTPCTVEQACDDATMKCVPRWTSGPCRGSQDCAAGAECVPQGDASYVCRVYKRIGESCSTGANECSPGAFCSSGTCVSWPTAGGACGDVQGESVACLESKCSAGIDAAGYSGQGTCIARQPVGAPCVAGGDGSNPCIAGTSCVSGTCAPKSCL